MQPLTRGPEADETKTMTVAWPHHACVPLSKRRQHRIARSTCAAASSVRSSPLGANTVCKPRNSFADALFRQGLMALMHPIIWCVRAQSVRDFVTWPWCTFPAEQRQISGNGFFFISAGRPSNFRKFPGKSKIFFVTNLRRPRREKNPDQ